MKVPRLAYAATYVVELFYGCLMDAAATSGNTMVDYLGDGA